MSTWNLDTTRIFVQKINDSDVQTIARLNPIGGGTTLHFYGYEDQITKVNALIVGLVDKEALRAMAKDESYHTLDSPYGNWGDYSVKSVSTNLTQTICQTLRPDLSSDSPVFEVELELYRDE